MDFTTIAIFLINFHLNLSLKRTNITILSLERVKEHLILNNRLWKMLMRLTSKRNLKENK